MTGKPAGTAIRVIIVDDEALAREGIRLRLEREPDVTIVGEFASADAALEQIGELAADVMFLDVQMPGLSGLDLLEECGVDAVPAVVFVTAYDRYAIQAFGVHALDYLVKPYDDERFAEMLERVRTRTAELRDGALGRQVRTALSGRLANIAASARGVTRLPVRTENGTTFVPADSIDWIEAARDHVRLHVGRETFEVRNTLTRVLEKLDPARFVRIHRSAVVNIDRITELQPYFHGEYIAILQNGRRLKVSRNWREELARALGVGL
ncbi:MAG: LytR/AlgR family response regulator transcription factor [Gemmatimonadales bacterium]